MRNPHGYLRIEGGPEGLVEEDTVKCNHCQNTGFASRGKVSWPSLSPAPQDHFTCKQCYDEICPRCSNLPCRHFEKWLEKMEKNAGVITSRLTQFEELAYKAARALGVINGGINI
jgi:hypothetical protein